MKQCYSNLAAFEIEEKKVLTPAKRIAQMEAIWSLAKEMGLHADSNPEEGEPSKMWAKLRAAIHERR